MHRAGILAVIALVACGGTALAQSEDQAAVVERSRDLVPAPPWPDGDERGMANTQGPGTWQRCAFHLRDDNARSYELSHVRSRTMPVSPFGVPLEHSFRPTVGLPGTRHAFNGEALSGEPGAQGTQMDAIGHFAYLPGSGAGRAISRPTTPSTTAASPKARSSRPRTRRS
jgi:hypothetical protein